MLFTIERNGQITKVAGTKSQYNRSAPVTIVTNESNENFFLAVGAADREEELAEKKAALEILKSEIVVIETTSTEIAKKLTSLTQVSQELRQKRSLCQNELKMVGTYTRQLENEQRKIGDWNRQLSTSVDSERQAHKVSLSLEVKNYQKYLISLNRKVQSGFAQSIGLHVAHQRLRTQRSAYNSTELELRRANEGLEEFQQLKLNAEKERKLTQEIFQELDEKLRDLERKSGGPKKFEKVLELMFTCSYFFPLIFSCSDIAVRQMHSRVSGRVLRRH